MIFGYENSLKWILLLIYVRILCWFRYVFAIRCNSETVSSFIR